MIKVNSLEPDQVTSAIAFRVKNPHNRRIEVIRPLQKISAHVILINEQFRAGREEGQRDSHAPDAKSNGETDLDIPRAFELPYGWKWHNEHDDIDDNIHQGSPSIPRIYIEAAAPGDRRIPKKLQRDANQKSSNYGSDEIRENQSCHYIACDSIRTSTKDTKIQD